MVCPDAKAVGDRTISIAVLTFRRPTSLLRTLDAIGQLAVCPPGWTIKEILVVDNDHDRSGCRTLAELSRDSRERCVTEPNPGISNARNRALDEASGDVLVFIDDDEAPVSGWPAELVVEMLRSGCALVGGPVRTEFEATPPAWVLDGRFFDRPEPPTGTPQSWLRTGNLAIDLQALRSTEVRFDPDFGRSGAEDVAFTTAARRAGLGLGWCATAPVVEWVPTERATRQWLVDRERRSTAGYIRATSTGFRSWRTVRACATIVARTIQGVGLVLAGFVSRRKHTMIRGAVLFSRARGTVEGLWGTKHVSYGAPDPD